MAMAAPVEAAAPAAQEWCYMDNEEQVQGPFDEQTLFEWYAGGYLDVQLPMRPSDAPDEQYAPLASFFSPGGLLDAPYRAWARAHGVELDGEGVSTAG